MIRSITIFSISILLTACSASHRIDRAISNFNEVKSQIQLGQSKNDVLKLLEPTQLKLDASSRKQAEKYLEGSTITEIYYARTGRQPDGLTTDDEFTPYIFKDNKLIAIGWTVLGGIKTQGKVIPRTEVKINYGGIAY